MADQTITVTFTNVPPGERVWVYLSSQRGEKCDSLITFTDGGVTTIPLPPPRETTDNDGPTVFALLAFTRGRQPVWASINLANATPLIRFANELELPINIWILNGDFRRQRVRALSSVLIANEILFEERTGLRLVVTPNDIIDATAKASSSKLFEGSDWSNIKQINTELDILSDGLNISTERSKKITVVYTEQILSDKQRNAAHTKADGSTVAIALDRFAFDDLLVHEVGHVLGLGDTEAPTNMFSPKPTGLQSPHNVMKSECPLRRHFTEGQIAAMYLLQDSIINTVFRSSVDELAISWYQQPMCDEIRNRSLCLAEKRGSNGGSEFDIDTIPSSFSAFSIGEPRALISAVPNNTSISKIEETVFASRERYHRRMKQLQREIMRGTDNEITSAILRTTIEEYVVADVVRSLEHKISMRRNLRQNTT